ncbi:translation elongation factor 4 [bacterium]|nr:translation elongation factor 4 [bacterium]
MSIKKENIRNFSIIAHIDHGKSTLADRFLEICGAVENRNMKAQYLDGMDLERERGITIKAQAARMLYTAKNGETYQLNLIDTPGHVDFSYEVSRSLAACEGAVLLVDASQGVQAQTLAHTYEAISQDLEIILALNKVDLPNADPERIKQEVEEIIGLDTSDTIAISAKDGTNVVELLEQIVEKLPAPTIDTEEEGLKALLFDSWYDAYLGVISLIKVVSGKIVKGSKVQFMSTGKKYDIDQVGVLTPKPMQVDSIEAGEVGFFSASIKEVTEAKVGDTVTLAEKPCKQAFPGFQEVKPTVFCGIFPTADQNFDELRDALEKLKLNDSSFSFEAETSTALGFGFRCGFLGLLHMEIIQERLEREYDMSVITTAPTVVYQVTRTDGEVQYLDNPALMPEPQEIDHIAEPIIKATIHTPSDYVGGIMKLCQDKRGKQISMEYASQNRVVLTYDLPLSEVVFDFYDKLKSVSKGYSSLDYEFDRYERSTMVKMDMLINGNSVDALSLIVHKDNAYYRGRELAKKLKEVIPRQMYEVAIQAAIGNKIVSRESISAMRKNVTAKCYGGDLSRKRKLLEKQKEGKKRMKRLGNVEVPQEAFLAILKID